MLKLITRLKSSNVPCAVVGASNRHYFTWSWYFKYYGQKDRQTHIRRPKNNNIAMYDDHSKGPKKGFFKVCVYQSTYILFNNFRQAGCAPGSSPCSCWVSAWACMSPLPPYLVASGTSRSKLSVMRRIIILDRIRIRLIFVFLNQPNTNTNIIRFWIFNKYEYEYYSFLNI